MEGVPRGHLRTQSKQKLTPDLTLNGINCPFCRCIRNTYHKESITTTQEVVVNVLEDGSSIETGKGGMDLMMEY